MYGNQIDLDLDISRTTRFKLFQSVVVRLRDVVWARLGEGAKIIFFYIIIGGGQLFIQLAQKEKEIRPTQTDMFNPTSSLRS